MAFRSLMPFGRSTGLSRSGSDRDPFTSLRHEMDRMFEDFTRDWNLPGSLGSGGFLSPKVNVAETERGLELTAELPGVDEKDIDLNLSNGVLTLKAEHGAEKEEKDEKKQFHVVERSYGTFLRRFALPFEADNDRIEASFEKGVLKVMVPRSPAAAQQSRRIEIKKG
jgi:HSP20 family protein